MEFNLSNISSESNKQEKEHTSVLVLGVRAGWALSGVIRGAR